MYDCILDRVQPAAASKGGVPMVDTISVSPEPNQPDSTQKKTFDYREYQKAYKKAHPDKVHRWQLTQAANKLKNAGYTVIAPEDAQKDGDNT